jgi:diguanylate cyclase (GGDEF)-like protein
VTILENPDLILRLERCRDLPTPPVVAEQIISLSADSKSDIAVLAEVVSLDPALTVKILRMANSPMYARKSKAESLAQAVMMFGWNGTLNLALSFSLVSKITSSSEGLDHNFFWKRSISAAVAAKHLGKVVGIDSRKEDLFLPGLLQDIGMLALDKAVPELYENINEKQHQHKIVQKIENDKIGVDHAAVGAWLLQRWNIPKRIIDLVAISHHEERYEKMGNSTSAENCIEVSNVIADCICSDEGKKDYHYAADVCEKILGLNEAAFLENLQGITQEIKDTAEIFDLDVGDPSHLNCIAEQAKELLLLRVMETLKSAEELHQEAEYLESKAKKLEDSVKLDALTNIYNRGYMEISLKREFKLAKTRGYPLTIVMVDLDRFKKINDSYGHDCGDKVLKYAVNLLKKCIRDSDSLFRYGGEEFLLMLPNTGIEGAKSISNRLIKSFNNNKFEYKNNQTIFITASAGIAIQGESYDFDESSDLLNVADQCMYEAKQNGRNQYIIYDSQKPMKVAVG